MLTNRILIVLVASVLLAACGRQRPVVPSASSAAEPFTAEAETAARAITVEAIRDVVHELADDSYEGRGPGTAGDVAAREYIADRLAAMGFEPGVGDSGYEQDFELVGVTSRQPPAWTFSTPGGDVNLRQHDEFIVASGVQSERAEIQNAELVFVGYGIEAPEYDWDDFAGRDLRGKILLFLNNDPDWDDDLFEGVRRLYYGRWTYKYEVAARQGAAGAIIIHTTPSAGYPWQVVQTSWTGEQFQLPYSGGPRVPIEAWVTEDAARRLVTQAGFDLDALVARAKSRDFVPVPLGIMSSVTLENTLQRTRTANVIGVRRGTDPVLAREYVIYTAHHDHLGIAPEGVPDRIYNGARDNASGVGMALAIGRAFAALPAGTRRSIMLLFVGAEEQGLLGSEYFASHPTVAPGRIAANINYDSGNIWGRTRDITFIGLGKSSLDGVALEVADYQGRSLRPDEFPDRGMYYRSDQFNFAKIGVPAFYFSSGVDFVGRPEGWGVAQINRYTEENYHQPSDELTDAWNFEGMVDDARFGFWAGRIVADSDGLPEWNSGDEFEADRLESLQALQ